MISKLHLAEMQEAQEAREGFRVTDKGSADWCLRKIAAYRAEMAENKQLVDAETQRLQHWLKKESEKAEQSIAYFEGLLERWLRDEHEQDERKRSISLPHGRIRLRQQQPQYDYEDEKVLPFLKQAAPDLVQTVITEKYSKSHLKAFVKRHCHVSEDGVPVVEGTGEIMPGVRITERPPKFEIEMEGL